MPGKITRLFHYQVEIFRMLEVLLRRYDYESKSTKINFICTLCRFLQMKIHVGGDTTSIHLGNAVVVIAALVLGGPLGGLAGALGMTIGDLLDPAYITYAPKTVICKLVIGLIAGFIAHKLGKINDSQDRSHIFKWVLLAAIFGLLANVILDPTIGYFYKLLILGKPAAELSFKINVAASAINAVLSIIVSVLVYMELYPILRKEHLGLQKV